MNLGAQAEGHKRRSDGGDRVENHSPEVKLPSMQEQAAELGKANYRYSSNGLEVRFSYAHVDGWKIEAPELQFWKKGVLYGRFFVASNGYVEAGPYPFLMDGVNVSTVPSFVSKAYRKKHGLDETA